MSQIATLPWDAAEHLANQENMANYLEAALEDGDATLVLAALGDIARALRPRAGQTNKTNHEN